MKSFRRRVLSVRFRSLMAVVVIRSLDDLSIEEAAVRLFELWKIGKQVLRVTN